MSRLAAVLLVLSLTPGLLAAQDDLEATVDVVVDAWSRGDVSALAQLMSAEGIALHLPGQSSPAMEVRQARAALDEFMSDAGEGEASLNRAEDLGGEPPRGFVELRWTGDAERPARGSYTVFVGFTVADGAWRIVEIRVFPESARTWP